VNATHSKNIRRK